MSTITSNPYIFFTGNCREAMEFYQDAFGGELTVQTYGEVGMNDGPMPADKLMHADLSGGDVRLMGSDTAAASAKAAKISLSLGGEDEEKLRAIFDKLSDGANVQQPLKKEFWGDIFGSLTDKYGVEWMINISVPKAD